MAVTRAAKAKGRTPPTPGIELVTSPSAARLMGEMTARVLELADRGEAVALVAPTTRLLDACRRALLAARAPQGAPPGAIAGVHLLHHRSFATHLLGRAWLHGLRDAPPPRLLSALEAEALARAAVEQLPASSALRRLCAERPRFVASLQRTLGELREASVAPAALGKVLGPRSDLALLHAAHEKLIARMESERHATDAAGHALQAAEAAGRLAEAGLLPWTRLVQHGAHELVAAQATLMESLSAALPALVLAPCGAGPAHATARRGLARFPGARADERRLDAPHEAGTLLDTEALGDEDATAEGGTLRLPARPVLEAFHVRGTRAEVELAARLCAQAHLQRGVPLEEIAVVARSLEPYASHLAAAFGDHGVPFTTSATSPLLRDPWARAAATLLQALSEDLPRPLVAELLRSPSARLHDKAEPSSITPDLWDEWTLKARVVRGADSYRDDMMAWHEADLVERARGNDVQASSLVQSPRALLRVARLAALGEIVARLDADRAAWSACRTHGEHASALREILARWLIEPAESASLRARDTVLAVLDEMELLDGLTGAAAPAPAPAPAATTMTPTVMDVRRLVDRALASATLPMGERDGSGVQVLSAMPARAIPFREIVILGLTQGSFPRRPRHDPFLDDAARLRLRQAGAAAMGVKSEARDEERQLLALLLGSATEAIHVAWQRADDDGGVRAPSLFLREIARLTIGRPDLEALVARRGADAELDARLPLMAVPGHPALAAAALRERFGRTTWRDALLEAAERPRRRQAVQALAEGTGRLRAGLAETLQSIGVVDSFQLSREPEARREQLAHDGLLGPGAVPVPAPLSASALQSFGRCAMQWLFERGFGIPRAAEEPDPLSVGADELGTCVHEVLEAVNLHAIAQGGAPEHLVSPEATEIARERWEQGVAALAGARRGRAPLAWEVLTTAWRSTIERFLRHDAERLSVHGGRVIEAESELSGVVEIVHGGRSLSLPLRGRVDRIVQLKNGWQVEDYKTSANVDPHVDKASVLKGAALQGLAYALLLKHWAADRAHPRGAEAWSRAAFIPVHPGSEDFEPKSLDMDEHEASWSETLAVLVQTWEAGAFPPRKHPRRCSWCDFHAACRRDHGPTRARLVQVDEWSDYLRLGGKSTAKPLLSDVPVAGAAPDGDEP